ncbi:putative HTH-type transcriptional regulator [Tsuneonella dongtanensis]|uniref:Putative HTH-type transcriptional regulator n=1 Tax=Tsuneonella dongtanensis TaxID=692370 RepID=A0A1B2ADZ7_9SPHN|nr:LexA family transcriptional regulator [Tsuneonella dongtanensis]ANY20321.1 putative HTH-type transcriptional regulator [Tsuneonella dongtanensis]
MVNPPDDPTRVRLLDLAQRRGVSLAGLSEMIGRNSSYLQQFIRKGSPRKLEEGDRRVLAQFFGVAESELGGSEENSSSGAPMRGDWIEVPRLALGAAAGPGALGTDERPFDSFRFSRRWLKEQGLGNGQLSTIRVQGDSMEPLLHDGDEILVDRAQRSLRDGIHVVRLGDALMVKRLAAAGPGRATLLSQNYAYPPLEVALEELEIVGRVVWKSGRL